jgi:hypothetical protein
MPRSLQEAPEVDRTAEPGICPVRACAIYSLSILIAGAAIPGP